MEIHLEGINLEIYNKVLNFFNGDEIKTEQWFNTHNPQLANRTPASFILLGRSTKLMSYIDSALELNQPPQQKIF